MQSYGETGAAWAARAKAIKKKEATYREQWEMAN